MKMEKCEFRAVIKYLYLKGLTPKQIKAELDQVHGTSAPAFATVYNWVNDFKRGRTSIKDGHRSGRPVQVTTVEMIEKIYDMVTNDDQIKVREIVEATGASQGTVFSILHDKLGVKKVSAKWVVQSSPLFSVENKQNHTSGSECFLSLSDCSKTDIETIPMLNAAVETVKGRGCLSLSAIKKYLAANYNVEKLTPFIKKYLNRVVSSDENGSSSIRLQDKKKEAKKATKSKKSDTRTSGMKLKKTAKIKFKKPTIDVVTKIMKATDTAKSSKQSGLLKFKVPMDKKSRLKK